MLPVMVSAKSTTSPFTCRAARPAEGKVAFVGGDVFRVVRRGIGGEADLGEHRIAVEEEFERDA